MPTTATTADKLLVILAEHPGRSAAELAQDSGVGRSTATRPSPPWNRSAG